MGLPRRPQGPDAPVAVVLASTGVPFGEEALRAAAEAGRGERVAVVSIAKLYGYAFGLPNPGLMPTPKEREAQARVVGDALDRLRRWGVTADAQVVITRNPAKSIARIARRRGAREVALQARQGSRMRFLVEGDPAAGLRRRLRGRCEVRAWYS